MAQNRKKNLAILSRTSNKYVECIGSLNVRSLYKMTYSVHLIVM